MDRVELPLIEASAHAGVRTGDRPVISISALSEHVPHLFFGPLRRLLKVSNVRLWHNAEKCVEDTCYPPDHSMISWIDTVEYADGLGDMVYVLDGAAIVWGVQNYYTSRIAALCQQFKLPIAYGPEGISSPTVTVRKVMECHRAFNHPVMRFPTQPSMDVRILRAKLFLEEMLEMTSTLGWTPADCSLLPVGSLDLHPSNPIAPTWDTVAAALAELNFACRVAARLLGLPLGAVVKEIHRSNMTKLGEDGKPILRADGKFLKGPNYERPNIRRVLVEYGVQVS